MPNVTSDVLKTAALKLEAAMKRILVFLAVLSLLIIGGTLVSAEGAPVRTGIQKTIRVETSNQMENHSNGIR